MSSDIIRAKNVFTTRTGGISTEDYSSLNLGSNRGDDPDKVRENYRRLCGLFNVGENDAVVTKQVHGNTVKIVTGRDRHECMSSVPYEADGIVTGEKNLLILCFTADCVPALLWDKNGIAAAAIHCGWRSSVSDILKNAVDAMESLGSSADNICCALGPAIGKCCFECDRDVTDAIDGYIGSGSEAAYERKGEKFFVDLRLANKIRLLQLGLKEENIDVSDECTMCGHDKYWSHRYTVRHGLNRGSQAAGIML